MFSSVYPVFTIPVTKLLPGVAVVSLLLSFRGTADPVNVFRILLTVSNLLFLVFSSSLNGAILGCSRGVTSPSTSLFDLPKDLEVAVVSLLPSSLFRGIALPVSTFIIFCSVEFLPFFILS